MDRTDAKVLTFLTLCLALSIAALKFHVPIEEYIQQGWRDFRKVVDQSLTLSQQHWMKVKQSLDCCFAPLQQQWLKVKEFLDYDKSGPWDPLRKIVVRENLKTYHHTESAWSMGGRQLFGFDSLNLAVARLHFPLFKGF